MDRCHESQAGRGERIRTSGLYVPNVALYQAKLHPDEALLELLQSAAPTARRSGRTVYGLSTQV